MTAVTEGDRYPLTLTTNHDLTDATVTIVVAHLRTEGKTETLTPTVTNAPAGIVELELDGTWQVGRHYLQLVIEQGAEKRIAPTAAYLTIDVENALG